MSSLDGLGVSRQGAQIVIVREVLDYELSDQVFGHRSCAGVPDQTLRHPSIVGILDGLG
jgi:hypothetical protein